jgi:hypothetical protein
MATDNIFIGRIAYNNGTKVDSALNTGNISLAVNNSVNFSTLNWCASCGVCNEYTIITDSYFMGKTTLENARAMCYCTNSTDLNVLLSSVNKIAATKFEGPFADLPSAMTWIEDNGLFITNQNYPPIVTDGNVLHLDGGLPASYPLVGTSWYDLTENSNNGVLINGVTYNSSVKGYLEFNGSNQYVSISGNTNIPVGNSNYTIGVWFNADTLGDKGLVGWGNYGTTNEANVFRLTSNGLINYWWMNDLSVTTTITPGNWYYAVATFDGTIRSIYVNGSLIGSDTPTGHDVTTSSNLTIGVTNTSEYFDGSIGDVQIFDRAITITEVLQNYNSFVTRYNGTNTEICLTPIYCDNNPTPTPTSTGGIPITPTPTPTPSGELVTCIQIIDTVIAPVPQSGPNNFFGVNVALDPYPVTENVTVTGYIREVSDPSNRYDFSITIIGGTQSGETANNVLMTGPADSATIVVTGVTPTTVTYNGNSVYICGFEPTPTQTPTQTQTGTPASTQGLSPTPTTTQTQTPTPSITPPSDNCVCYEYENTGDPEEVNSISWLDCNNESQQIDNIPYETGGYFCAILGSVTETEGIIYSQVDESFCGGCFPSPSPTNTSTPTSTPTPTVTATPT